MLRLRASCWGTPILRKTQSRPPPPAATGSHPVAGAACPASPRLTAPYLHVGVGKAAGRQVVGVHGNRLLLGGHVLIFVKRQWVHRTLIIQTAAMGREKRQGVIPAEQWDMRTVIHADVSTLAFNPSTLYCSLPPTFFSEGLQSLSKPERTVQ